MSDEEKELLNEEEEEKEISETIKLDQEQFKELSESIEGIKNTLIIQLEDEKGEEYEVKLIDYFHKHLIYEYEEEIEKEGEEKEVITKEISVYEHLAEETGQGIELVYLILALVFGFVCFSLWRWLS